MQLSLLFVILFSLMFGGTMFSSLIPTHARKDVLTRLQTSSLATGSANALDAIRTPGIDYISGYDLKRFGDSWIDQVARATKAEPHLLPKTAIELKTVAHDHHIIVAIDTHRKHMVVGCIALWQLGQDERGLDWFELGTLWVHPDYRYHGKRHMPIADALYRRVLAHNQDKNILATTTNLSAIHLGMRHGMQMISFLSLPPSIHRATCVCPSEKTGVSDNARCLLKDASCRVRVPFPTWLRMDKPDRVMSPKS